MNAEKKWKIKQDSYKLKSVRIKANTMSKKKVEQGKERKDWEEKVAGVSERN